MEVLLGVVAILCVLAFPFAFIRHVAVEAGGGARGSQAAVPAVEAALATPPPPAPPIVINSGYDPNEITKLEERHAIEEEELERELVQLRIEETARQATEEDNEQLIDEAWPDTEVLDHVLVWGPPGTGKTTMAHVVANTLEPIYGFPPKLVKLTPMQLQDYTDVAKLVGQVEFGTLVFIDEIHSLAKAPAEGIYNVLEYGTLFDMREGYKLPPHTFIGATTEPGTLLEPFRERFPIEVELAPLNADDIKKLLDDLDGGMKFPETFAEYHGQEEAKTMVWMHLAALNRKGFILPEAVKAEVARRSVGIPRIAKNITRHMLALSKALGRELGMADAQKCFRLLGIDRNGLHRSDRRVVGVLLSRNNQPIGMAALASAAVIHKSDLENMVEGRLVRLGYIERTPRGRILTAKAITEYGG